MKVWAVLGSNVMGKTLRNLYASEEKAREVAAAWKRNCYDWADEMVVEEWEVIE